jgi:hypothetical protein
MIPLRGRFDSWHAGRQGCGVTLDPASRSKLPSPVAPSPRPQKGSMSTDELTDASNVGAMP